MCQAPLAPFPAHSERSLRVRSEHALEQARPLLNHCEVAAAFSIQMLASYPRSRGLALHAYPPTGGLQNQT